MKQLFLGIFLLILYACQTQLTVADPGKGPAPYFWTKLTALRGT